MAHRSTALLQQCTRIFVKRPKLSKERRKVRGRSASLGTTWSQHEPHACENDLEPLMDTPNSVSDFAMRRKYVHQRKSVSLKRPQYSFTIWRWWRLPFAQRSGSLMTILLLIWLCSISAAVAIPNQPVKSHHLNQRQSIPDRFGNTGNEPAPAAPQRPPQSEPSAVIMTTTISAESTMTLAMSTASTTPPAQPDSNSATLETSLIASSPVTSASPTPTTPISSTFISTRPTPGIENQLQRTIPQNPLSPATIVGIAVGSTIFFFILLGLIFLLHRRRKAREIDEIPIRRSKLGSRLGFRVFSGANGGYDDKIARSRSAQGKEMERILDSPASDRHDAEKLGTSDDQNVDRPPTSPSIYSPRLKRARRISTMTFGSVSGWLDKSTISRPQPAFTGTPSQMLDAPRPLFARANEGNRTTSPPRPVRPESAEPLGRLSGMGFGLGMRSGG